LTKDFIVSLLINGDRNFNPSLLIAGLGEAFIYEKLVKKGKRSGLKTNERYASWRRPGILGEKRHNAVLI